MCKLTSANVCELKAEDVSPDFLHQLKRQDSYRKYEPKQLNIGLPFSVKIEQQISIIPH